VEEDVAPARRDADALAVDADVVVRRVRAGAQLEHGRAVDRHAPLRDEHFRRAPRGHARGGEDLLEPVV
jgi:hypothetical protein